MSNSKDKRIKKLKRTRIWPSILGLFFIILIYALLIVIVLSVSAYDIVQKKLTQGNSRTMAMASVFENYTDDDKERIDDVLSTYLKMMPEVEAIWVADSDDNEIWTSSDISPNTENVGDFYLSDNGHMRLVIEEDTEQILNIGEDGITINDEKISALHIFTIDEHGISLSTGNEHALMQFKIWFVQEAGDLDVYVLQDVYVYSSDFLMLLMCILTFGVMLAIFVLYYLISFIGLILNIRRTTKIIYTDMVTGGDNWLHFVKKGVL